MIDSFGIGRFRRHQMTQLSTGTRRVVDLASIVLARPRLLLLDEPTAGIAQREAEAFVPLLRRLHELADTTVVLVEHDVPLVFALCSHVVMLESGSVVSSGPPDEVARDPGPGRVPRGQRGGPGRLGGTGPGVDPGRPTVEPTSSDRGARWWRWDRGSRDAVRVLTTRRCGWVPRRGCPVPVSGGAWPARRGRPPGG